MALEVRALHNHFFFESPRIFYMHVHGHGKAADLARMVKPGLDLIGRDHLNIRVLLPAERLASPVGRSTR